MTCFNKQDYKQLKSIAKGLGVTTATTDTTTYRGNINGISVAFRPSIENTNGKMLEVAVSYCSNEDTFKPKHGKYQALLKLAQGEFVQLPLADLLRSEGSEETAHYLLGLFDV